MNKQDKLILLFDYYGDLLSESQRNYFESYYFDNLSLSEIAENEEITRQAVRDNLKKGENNLFEYEEKLGFMKKIIEQEENERIIETMMHIAINAFLILLFIFIFSFYFAVETVSPST